jgi:transcriptional regulator with XRE-family HTH domain
MEERTVSEESAWRETRSRLLRDPELRKEMENTSYIVDLIVLRSKRGISQEQLAERVGTKQSSIARLESGTQEPSLRFLRRVAEALGGRVVVAIVPAEEGESEPVQMPHNLRQTCDA